MQSTTTENTVQRWESVITDLTAKQHAAREHIGQLQTHKRDVALEAAIGGADAKRKLDKSNSELARLSLENDDLDMAMSQAEKRLAEAREAEAAIAEQARQAELRTLASTVLKHATEFSAGLQHATKAGAALKQTIHKMIAVATPVERSSLNELLQPGAFMRAAEHAGLRAHLEFQGYTGLREHIVSLEDALSVHLGRWLEQEQK